MNAAVIAALLAREGFDATVTETPDGFVVTRNGEAGGAEPERRVITVRRSVADPVVLIGDEDDIGDTLRLAVLGKAPSPDIGEIFRALDIPAPPLPPVRLASLHPNRAARRAAKR